VLSKGGAKGGVAAKEQLLAISAYTDLYRVATSRNVVSMKFWLQPDSNKNVE